jgi:hypothetical protein
MADIKLQENNDIAWNDFRWTDDNAESVAQKIKLRLLKYFGEYFLDIEQGVPYFQTILKKGVSKDYVDTLFIDTITETTGVLSLDTFESILDGGSGVYQFSFVATTVEGVTFQFNGSPISLF